jgi:hypothetical protein
LKYNIFKRQLRNGIGMPIKQRKNQQLEIIMKTGYLKELKKEVNPIENKGENTLNTHSGGRLRPTIFYQPFQYLP